MRLSSRDKLIVSVVLVMLLTFAGVMLLVVPQFRRVGNLNVEIRQTDDEIQMAESLLTRRQSAKQEAARTEAVILELDNQVPAAPELPSLIVTLQDLANSAGLDFAQLSPAAAPEAREGFSAVSVVMNVTGTWPDVIDLLERLPKVVRVVRVVNLSVQPEQRTGASEETETTGPQRVQAALQLEVYTSAGQGAVPAAPANGQ